MNDPTHPAMRRHHIDRAHEYGMHTFVAETIDDDADASVWRCTGCKARILGYELEDNLWHLRAGVTCAAYAIALTNTQENNRGHQGHEGRDQPDRDSIGDGDRGARREADRDQRSDQGQARRARGSASLAEGVGGPQAEQGVIMTALATCISLGIGMWVAGVALLWKALR